MPAVDPKYKLKPLSCHCSSLIMVVLIFLCCLLQPEKQSKCHILSYLHFNKYTIQNISRMIKTSCEEFLQGAVRHYIGITSRRFGQTELLNSRKLLWTNRRVVYFCPSILIRPPLGGREVGFKEGGSAPILLSPNPNLSAAVFAAGTRSHQTKLLIRPFSL